MAAANDGVLFAFNDRPANVDLNDIVVGREIIHDIEHHFLERGGHDLPGQTELILQPSAHRSLSPWGRCGNVPAGQRS